MRVNFEPSDWAPVGLGLLALLLAGLAILGVIRPEDGTIGGDVPILAGGGLLSGLVGLYVGRTTGPGRQVAIVGAAVGFVALALWGGALALESLLEQAG